MVSRRCRDRGRSDSAIGSLAGAAAGSTVDATNLVMAPGFIDLLGQSEFNVLVDGRAASKILQGITTEVTGEGSSIAPVNDRMIGKLTRTPRISAWRALADARRLLPAARGAVAHDDQRGEFVGAGGIRNYVIGKDDRPATPAELERMKALAAQAMRQGALGLTSKYGASSADRFASTEEIIELAKVAARAGGDSISRTSDPKA